MLKHAAVLVVAALSLSFCSCQSLSNSGRQAAAQLTPAQATSAQANTAQGNRPQSSQPQPGPGRPVVTAGYYPPALPSHNSVALVPAAQPAPCPCCAPKQRFAFSDAGAFSGHGTVCDANGACNHGACGHAGCSDGECVYRPGDEYICDGGDNAPSVVLRKDQSVDGLGQEDTIVHFDTLKGDREYTASNKVCLYAPRFGAVRQVTGLVFNDQANRVAQADKSLPPATGEEIKIVSDMNQPLQPVAGLGIKQTQSVLDRNKGLTAENTKHLAQSQLELLPYEQLDLIRRGVLSNNDKPLLAQSAKNAIVWTENKAVQVVVDKKLPLESRLGLEPGETVMYDLGGKPKMRIIKIADKSEAQPGEIVSFTLRFDNVGDQKVGNVTIIDNLTTRLEYIEDSQECSHEAVFTAEANEGESAILRWEIKDSMRVREGGIIRFKCRVR